MNFRKGDSTGARDSKREAPKTDLDWITTTPTDELPGYLPRMTREVLIDAHRYCERNPKGNATRKAMIARQLRALATPKQEVARA